MPRHLVQRLNAARSRVSELATDLGVKLQEYQLENSQLETMVAELRTLAASLSGRESSSGGPDLCVAIEALSDSIRARSACIRTEADTSKKRFRARRLLSQDRAKLQRLLRRYEEETGVALAMQTAEEGNFPWQSPSLAASATDLPLSSRRMLAEKFVRLRRSEEELAMVKEEMRRLLASSMSVAEELSVTLQVRTFF